MIHKKKILPCLFIAILFVSVIIIPLGKSCKDIVISSSATAGDYSLLLKVRDPSRPGLQVLCRVPKGTLYTYHHPWSGKPWDFLVNHTFFGVATQGDTLPNIVKAGMVLTDAGLAIGDADTLSHWINPTQNAWDDFDWIRYAAQTADSEDQAVYLLTTEAIDRLHATGVSENLFLVGSQRAVVIEADTVHYTIQDVPGVLVMSNYPKDLWKTQILSLLPIASSFEVQKETRARHGSVVHLRSICGVKITQITPSSITVKAVPLFAFKAYKNNSEKTIVLGERATVGPYSVRLLEIDGKAAKISVCTAMHAWEDELQAQIQPVIGNITMEDTIRWSRWHSSDLDGLRPMCDDQVTYEAVMIFKIPKEHADLLSSGWFAANHACSSIYVPAHICDDDFFEPYQTGDAAALSLALLQRYGHGTLTSLCQSVEQVFFFENEINELFAHSMIHTASNVTSFLTAMDQGMQQQAFLTEQLWLSAPNASRGLIQGIWEKNYTITLQNIDRSVSVFSTIHGMEVFTSTLEKIASSISDSQRNTAVFQGRSTPDF